MRRKDKHLYKTKTIELYRDDVDALGKLAKKSKLGKFKPYVEALLRKAIKIKLKP